MIQAEDFQKSQLQLVPGVLTVIGPQPKKAITELKVSAPERVLNSGEITLSVSQVLVGTAVALGSITLFIWALVKLWLFGR